VLRILAIINDPISTFLVCLRAINTSGNTVINFLVHENTFLEHFLSKTLLLENLLRSGSGSGSGRFQKSDPDPVEKRHDPQHC
jgi:hypothetical protein